ncbi:hypothetical protein Sste5346_003815 [Sporothrix stenoceras]|uniref:F-box domain-containing protein n=1 Tax=Sporothrix stenoceras TaxID=5173 RepID=A0ABR3ZBG1_9PEZI
MDDLTLDDIGLEMHCPLDDGHLTLPTAAEPERPQKRQKRVRQGHDHNDTASSLSPSRGSDSALERLPLEISSMIFLQLDIPTIVSTRRVSRHIMASIDALHPYRRIRIHCPDVLRAAVGLSARSFDLATLYKTLRSWNCDQCGTACNGSEIKGSNDKGRLASYLYMVTCTRVCYDCFVYARYYEGETFAYQWLQGTGMSPKFLSHVTEDGRIIGFAIEYIEGARTAGPEDFPACQKALAKLHALGIRHGDINRHNFLIRESDGTAVLIDFEAAHKPATAEELKAEAELLKSKLEDESGLGGPGRSV